MNIRSSSCVIFTNFYLLTRTTDKMWYDRIFNTIHPYRRARYYIIKKCQTNFQFLKCMTWYTVQHVMHSSKVFFMYVSYTHKKTPTKIEKFIEPTLTSRNFDLESIHPQNRNLIDNISMEGGRRCKVGVF